MQEPLCGQTENRTLPLSRSFVIQTHDRRLPWPSSADEAHRHIPHHVVLSSNCLIFQRLMALFQRFFGTGVASGGLVS